MEGRKALLVIDMQKGCFPLGAFRFEQEKVIKRINTLSKQFRAADSPVIFIQQNSSKWNRFIPHTTEWELLSALDISAQDITINKIANDSFYQSNLDAMLKERAIKELFITGFATEFCVEATIQSALAKDYNITVIGNAHTTGDKAHMQATKIIDHYNWVWQNMLPTGGKVQVIEFEVVHASFKSKP